jgi:hypothetical protein
MAEQTIEQLWMGLRDVGITEVMLYLPDDTACRCDWDDTAVVSGMRVALLGDQDRGIVRILPIQMCTGIGVASPKGTDPVGYRAVVKERLFGVGTASESAAEPISP